MPATTPGWASRLADVLGAPPTEVTEEHLRTMVDNAVREDADLEFKEAPYGKSDSERREFAGDIAAMANDRGGLIVIGMRDQDDAAAELTPVELVDGEEGRLRQTAASNLAPYVSFEIVVVPSSDDPGRGYYLLAVPPSSLRPHAVRQDRNLRYPRRDGTTTRWLSETEVADMYRDRFRIATDQSERVASVLEDGLGAMDTRDDAFLAVGLAPTAPGYMSIDRARVRAVEQWAIELGRRNYWRGFFFEQPSVRVGARRLRVGPIGNRPPNWVYLELHSDGSAFAGVRLVDPRQSQREPIGILVLNETLLWDIARCLRVVGRHATDHTGVWGDVLVEACVIGSEMQLSYLDQWGASAHPIEGGQTLDGPLASRHTLVVDALVAADQDLLASTRLVASDLFNAFGSAEVLQITPNGTLRIRHIHGDHADIRRLAEQGGAEITEEPVPE
jgi:Putative DNA-binding domain